MRTMSYAEDVRRARFEAPQETVCHEDAGPKSTKPKWEPFEGDWRNVGGLETFPARARLRIFSGVSSPDALRALGDI